MDLPQLLHAMAIVEVFYEFSRCLRKHHSEDERDKLLANLSKELKLFLLL